MAGGRLSQQFLGRLCAGTGSKLFCHVVGELNEVSAAGHRSAFTLQLDNGAGLLIEAIVEAKTAEGGFAAAATFLDFQALLAQDVLRLFHFPTSFGKGLL